MRTAEKDGRKFSIKDLCSTNSFLNWGILNNKLVKN